MRAGAKGIVSSLSLFLFAFSFFCAFLLHQKKKKKERSEIDVLTTAKRGNSTQSLNLI